MQANKSFFDKFGNSTILITISVIILVIVLGTLITALSYITSVTDDYQGIIIFSLITIVYSIGQHIILGYANSRSKDLRKAHIKISVRIVQVSQIILISILFFIILQMLTTSGYSTILLKAVVCINYVLCAIMTGLLSYLFFSWFISSRNLVVILYALAMGALSFNAFLVIPYVMSELSGKDQRGLSYVLSTTNYKLYITFAENVFNSLFVISGVLSFTLTWVATVFLLRHYSTRVGKKKFWIIVTIPLLFFFGQFQSLFYDFFAEYRYSNPITFGIVTTIIFNVIKPTSGILFGIVFWSIARSVDNTKVRQYMMISAYGMILLFASNQPLGLTFLPYPPFGLVTISFLGIASYLILVGIYSSALSIANDIELRRSVKKSVKHESNLLGNIGSAQMDSILKNRVMKVVQDLSGEIAQETGVESSIGENELRDYVQSAIDEVKTRKK